MFLATINPSVCKITRTLPSRTVLNNDKFYTFDNGSCQLFTQTGYLNTTDAGVTNYYYFPNNNGCGSGVATYFTGSEWTNLNSWSRVDGQIPELLPFCLSTVIACVQSPTITTIKSNSGPVPYINCLCLWGTVVNCIDICANNICFSHIVFSYPSNCGFLYGKNITGWYVQNFGTICATGSESICMIEGYNYACGSIYGNSIGGVTLRNYGLISGNAVTVYSNYGVIVSKCTYVSNNFCTNTGIFCSSDFIEFTSKFSGIICSNPSICFRSLGCNLAPLICTTGNIQFSAPNYGTVCNSSTVTFHGCNYGTVCNSSTVIFDSSSINFGTIFGLTCFVGTNTNCCCVVGNAYFELNAKNFGTVSGTGYFKNLACNSGIVTCACLY